MKHQKYDVIDEKGNLICSCITNKEFQDIFGLSKVTGARKYVLSSMKLKNLFTVIINENNKKVLTMISPEFFTFKMLEEWRYMNKMYGKKVVVSKMETV